MMSYKVFLEISWFSGFNADLFNAINLSGFIYLYFYTFIKKYYDCTNSSLLLAKSKNIFVEYHLSTLLVVIM